MAANGERGTFIVRFGFVDSVFRIRMDPHLFGSLDPDPGAMKLTKNSLITMIPALENAEVPPYVLLPRLHKVSL